MNIGEGAGTIIYSIQKENETNGAWELLNGAISNDANHISGPSRTGEGSYRVLMETIKGFATKDIAFINAHGIGTQMMEEIRVLAKAFGCTDLQLGVYPQNDAAVSFYQKCGFAIKSIDMQRKV